MARALLVLAWVVVAPASGATLRTHMRGKQEAKVEMWRPCGNEGETIPEEGHVRFGFGLTWVEGRVPRGASCAVTTFGEDPSPGIMKQCECSGEQPATLMESRQVKDDMGLTWTRCADEGGDCRCDSGTVRFGNTARWVTVQQGAVQGSHMACTKESFGGNDPALAQNKECWCQVEPPAGSPPPANPSVAIVLLSRRAPDLKTWLQYHLDYMSVKHVFMDVEDSPHFDEAWQSLSKADQDRVTVWKTLQSGPSGSDLRPKDDYTTLQARQLTAMTKAKAASKEMGIDWLLHIDDDELLYTPLHKPIGEVLASVPQGFDQAYIPNVEAIYGSSDVKSCFTETSKVNMNRYTFVSYANGKSAVRVADDDAFPAGPHQWRTSQGLEDKFWELGNTSPEKVNGIPFKFYKASITRMQHCRKREEAGESFLEQNGECSQSALKDLWSHWKTAENPAIKQTDLMPITIPWDKIKAMSL